MSEPTINEINAQYADAVRIIAEQRTEIDALKRELEIEKSDCDGLRLKILQLQDKLAGACI